MSSRYFAHFVLGGGDPDVEVDAELASGTGSALNASVHVAPNAELAAGTGQAFDATVSTATNVSADAELASGAGAAGDVTAHVAVNAGLATGAGQALDATAVATIAANADVATGTGSASGVTAHVAPTSGIGAGTGTAHSATASMTGVADPAFQNDAFQNDAFQTAFIDSNSPLAGRAVGDGDAYGTDARISVNAGVVTGSGAAYDATAYTATGYFVLAEVATGTGSALGAKANVKPTVLTVVFPTGLGVAPQPRVSIKVNAEVAAGTGAANDATVSLVYTVWVTAQVASGTGAAHGPRAAITASPSVISGTGAAYDAAPNAYAVDDTVEGDIGTGYMPPLAAPIDDNDTTIIVTTSSSSPPDLPFVVAIDDELVLVTNVVGTTWTVVRGYGDSTAASHGSGAIARPALAKIVVGGVDVTFDVSYQFSRFTTACNGQAGIAEIWIRDLERTRSFTTGKEVVVTFRGIRMWGGFVASIRRQYVFAEGTGLVGDEPRWLILDCVDYNVLFNKRVFWDPTDPDDGFVKRWPNGTRDSIVISELVTDYLDLEGDGLKFDIHHVGTPALPQISCDPNAPDVFGIGSAGWTWGEVMNAISSQTGAVYYIDPDKVFRYVDDGTQQSRFGWDGLSDAPDNVTTIGYRDVEFTSDGTRLTNDHLQWGAGQGSNTMVFARTEDSTSIATHGLWQTAELRFDMYCQDSIDQRGETWVYGSPQNRRGGKDDRFFSRATVREPYFRVADVLSLESTEFDIDDIVPVRNAEITFPTPWDIKCILTLSHELDAPWATLEFWRPDFDIDFDFRIKEPEIHWPPPWDVFDPCEEVGNACLEDFFRDVEDGWGTSDWGRIWQHYTGSGDPSVSTTVGDDTGIASLVGGENRMLTLGMATGLPVEILVKWRMTQGGSNGYAEFGVGDPETSGDVNTLSYEDTVSNHRLRLNHNDTIANFTLPAEWDASDGGWWWARYRMLSTTQSAGSMWPDGEDEPEDWQVQVSGPVLGPEYEITVLNGSTTALDVDSIEITEGLCPDGEYMGEALGLMSSPTPGPAPAGLSWSHPVFKFRHVIKTVDGELRFTDSDDQTSILDPFINSDLNLAPPPGLPSLAETLVTHISGSSARTLAVINPGVFLTISSEFEEDSADEWEIWALWPEPDWPNEPPYPAGGPLGPGTPWEDSGASQHPPGIRIVSSNELGPVMGNSNLEIADMGTWAGDYTDPTGCRTFYAPEGDAVLTCRLLSFTSSHFDSMRLTLNGSTGLVGNHHLKFAVPPPGMFDQPVTPCGGADPGEFAEAPPDGPVTGESVEFVSETGPNGGAVFLLDDQFQRASTEVWVNGLRIRLGDDYLEYPRSRKIEILPAIVIDGTTRVQVNYVVWTIESPAPDVEPE